MPIFRHLLVGLGLTPEGTLSDGSRAALDHARWLGTQGRIRCTLLLSRAQDEVWDPKRETFQVSPAPQDQALEGALGELRDAGIDADLQVTDERALLAMLRAVVKGPCDLVLVGKRAVVDGGPVLGSTAARLLRKCPSAVWAVRPGTKPPPRRLLAATDLNDSGAPVLYRAAQVAAQADAELHVVHALQLTMEAQMSGEGEQWLARERKRARERIRAELQRHASEGWKGEPEIHVGLTSPSSAVLECVDRFEPDLVVMGTLSRSGIPGLLIGNTAERLLHRLDVSLLTLKPADFVCPVRFDERGG